MAVAATPVAAQGGERPIREMRAFEPAWAAGIGFIRPGRRASSGSVSFGYSNSVLVEATGETALGRRLGLIGGLSVAPFTKRRREDQISVLVTESAPLIVGDLALGWRLKPWAPAFVAVGGGFTYAPKTPTAEEGTYGAPHALLALGIDHGLSRRYGFRLRFALRVLGTTKTDLSTVAGEAPLDASLALSIRGRRSAFR